jgi:hypothetical protein
MPSRRSQTAATDWCRLYRKPDRPPVDTSLPPAHGPGVSKKPHKVGEPKTTYAAKKPAKAAAPSAANQDGQIRYIDPATARKLTKDILDKHHDLFRKLAQ